MDLNAIWIMVEPWVTAILSALGGGAGVYILCRSLLGRAMKKYDTDNLAHKVANSLTAQTLDIDVTAVTEKKLDKIEIKLMKKVEAMEELTSQYKSLLVLIAGAVSHFKALSEEERIALTGAMTALKSDCVIPEPKKTVRVELKPVEIRPQNTANNKVNEPAKEQSMAVKFD